MAGGRGVTCKTCRHSAIDLINEKLMDHSYTLQEIVEWLDEDYPNEETPSAVLLSRHRKNHLSDLMPTTEVKLQDGALVSNTGAVIERVSVMDALNTIVTLGLRNALQNPDKVSVRDSLEAARIMKSIGMASGEMEDFLKEWRHTVKRKDKKAPRKVVDVDLNDNEVWDFSA